ncbi:MAG: enoyl-CoA hydratase/isomerase family protein [Rhodococcus sp. (in: high G+C Gram-positive bacteria)]|uniref:enoyl-CoA hydratase/isomerase family protein n=1 Tax=Rhodococcus sp. TaxID=1831 RepID=UPI002ADD11EC|nr:enoyl-CoA hydratase/isomerase family protein [Rhodococcus sp. (in: high G+C Gram-positive bacteria)]
MRGVPGIPRLAGVGQSISISISTPDNDSLSRTQNQCQKVYEMTTPHPGFIQVERDGDVATITLRREDKQNALSAHLETALLRTLSTPAVTSSRAIILTGGDKVFSAGGGHHRTARHDPCCD